MRDGILSGTALLDRDLEPSPVDIIIERGVIRAIEENPGAPECWIIPALYNAHTHIADTVAMDCDPGTGNLADIVTPPDGLKHRILRSTPRADLVSAMRSSIRTMGNNGISGFADFREGGVDGVQALQEASQGSDVHPLIFGRDGGEEIADGLGISSVRDVPDTESRVRNARASGKPVAFHAGERDPDDIEGALAFDPDLLVHMTHATDAQLKECADRNIPIAVCARSNWTLGVAGSPSHPPLEKMLRFGCRIYLGTDNVMFVQPDLFSEMTFIDTVYRIPPEDLLRAAIDGAELTAQSNYIQKGARANLICVDPVRANIRFSKNLLKSAVKRINSGMIMKNVFNSIPE